MEHATGELAATTIRENRRLEFVLLGGRVAVLPLVLLLWASSWGFELSNPKAALFFACLGSIAVGLTYFLLRAARGPAGRSTLIALMACDLASITALLLLTGGVYSPLLILYFGPMLVSYLYGDFSFAVCTGVASLLSLAIATLGAMAPGLESTLGPRFVADPVELYRIPLLVLFLGLASIATWAEARRRTNADTRGDRLENKLTRANDELGRIFGDLEAAMETRRADEQQLYQMRQQLLRAERFSAAGKLAAGALHDLADPLSVIISDAEMFLLRNEERPEKAREVIRRILTNTQHMSLLLDNLRLLTKQRGDQVYGPVDMKNVVWRVLTALEPMRKRRGAVVDALCGDDVPAVFGVESQFEQMIANLVVNAFEASSDAGGRITVRTRAADGIFTLEIEDDGEGVAAHNLGRIFEPFFTTRESPNSLGLGLFSAMVIVQEHGGTINVRSKPGAGAVFTVDLPLTPPTGGKGD